MKVRYLTPADEARWDDFVLSESRCTFFHQIKWKLLIEKVHPRRFFHPRYLFAENENGIQGILPLFLFKHWYFGNKLISVPFAMVGGCCVNSQEAEFCLVDEAIRICKRENASYLELRQIDDLHQNLLVNDHYHTFILDLTPGVDAIFKGFRKDIRKRIRESESKPIRIDLETRDIETFYTVYSEGQHRLGTPVIKRDWVMNLFYDFPAYHKVAIAYHEDKPIAVKLIRMFKQDYDLVLGYALPEYRDLLPNHRIIWSALQDACERGFKHFDFGRSIPESGTFSFKEGWGTQDIQFHYQYFLNHAKHIPDTSQTNTSRQSLAAIWKRLPLPVANRLGPMIRTYFP